MTRSNKNVSVKVTPGRNAPVDPVVRLEDLLQKLQQAPAPKAVRGGASAGSARELVAELEARLRAQRGPAKKSGKR